jgi:putative flippase GtrA
VDAGTLFILHGVLGIWLPLSTAMSFLASFAINFGLNRVWSFGAPAGMITQAGRYFALVLANLSATVLLVSGLVHAGMPYLVAKVLTAAALAAVNYAVSKRWIFVQAPVREPVG